MLIYSSIRQRLRILRTPLSLKSPLDCAALGVPRSGRLPPLRGGRGTGCDAVDGGPTLPGQGLFAPLETWTAVSGLRGHPRLLSDASTKHRIVEFAHPESVHATYHACPHVMCKIIPF